MSRGLKFRIKDVEKLYYPCSENKDAGQLPNDHKANLRLCSRICKRQDFSRGSIIDKLNWLAVVLTHTHKVKNRVTSVMLSEV